MEELPRIYLAGPLFSSAERIFNASLAEILSEWSHVYLPQRDGGLVSEMIGSGVPDDVAVQSVFQRDLQAIRASDCLVAILDGRAIDEGVAFEIGVAFSQSINCIGLQTDSRRLASWGNNPMITGALALVLHSVEDLVIWAKTQLPELARTQTIQEYSRGIRSSQ